MTGTRGPARGRGQRAGIDRARIIEAARGVDPDQLTMQAVADRLGVARSALNYHISDRDQLRRLVAADAFDANLRPQRLDFDDWRDLVRAHAAAIRDAALSTGDFVDYFRYDASSGPAALDAFENFLARMVAAGFDIETAARTLELIAGYAMAFAKDVIMNAGQVHPQTAELRDALAGSDEHSHPHVREHLSSSAASLYGEEQFDFSLGLVIAGLERRLDD